MRAATRGWILARDPLQTAEPKATGSRRGRGRLGACVVLAATGTALALPAGAASFAIRSATLTWEVPHEAAPGTGTLSNYATTIGGGSVSATAPAGGGPITGSSTPAPAAGATYPFTFPGTTSGPIGTYDPAAKNGSIQLAGTITFTAHESTFFSVVNPRLSLDAPQSIRVVANGTVAGGTVGSPGPPIEYGTSPARQTVFALDGLGATTTANPDGSYTISNLIPSGVPAAAPTGYLSTSGPFDGIRPWFAIERPNQRFAVTFAPVRCADTIDNDGDGKVDFGGANPDPGCTSATDDDETDPAPPDPGPPPETDVSKNLPVTGAVAQGLSLSLVQPSAVLGPFVPGVATDYTTSVAANVTSTFPNAALSVVDGGSNPGFLKNGSATLASPLQARAGNAATPATTYATVGATPATLLGYGAPVSNDLVTIGLKQPITASEPLTAGTYGKTLTFTVATTTP